MEQLFKKIDSHQDEFIQLLKEAVAIKSVSADAAYRDEVFRMITWTAEKLKGIGATVELIDNGMQSLPDGKQIKLPPVLFGTLGRDKSKKTLCVYGHLDVQPATKSDGWNTEPFELTVKDGKMFGRGSSDDKGPVLAWVNAIQTMQELKIDIPVNIKFVFEGMEESGSEGLVDILTKHKDSFLGDVDATCISDNYWLGRNKPCLTYGLRGVCYYFVEVSNPKQDLHSGIYGGALHEPMTSLIKLLGTLTKTDGTINIDGLYDLVAPMKEGEDALYENIDFDPVKQKKFFFFFLKNRSGRCIFGVSPDYTREGCSIPITLTFQELTEKNVMLLPIGACDDMAHSQNEKMNISNYMNGIKTLAAFLLELKGAL
uniref:M20_dimer domain-containing protein n=1 Tax=Bursaphelenchus xylophilus TaxID=6326 RepID=A0A1I7RQI7_BURXY